jgi:hypothetical protein
MHISLLLCSAGNKILGINDMIEIQSSSFTDRIPNTALLRLRDIQKTEVRDIQNQNSERSRRNQSLHLVCMQQMYLEK